MKKIMQFILVLGSIMAIGLVHAGTNWQNGVIFDHSSISTGLLIRFDPAVTPLPDNCVGSPSGWMLIPEANKTVIATTLLAIAMNNRNMTVYTNGLVNGWCQVNQVDPAN